jgi:uncharacterized protein (DUF305 family)
VGQCRARPHREVAFDTAFTQRLGIAWIYREHPTKGTAEVTEVTEKAEAAEVEAQMRNIVSNMGGRGRAAIGGAVAGLALLWFTAGALSPFETARAGSQADSAMMGDSTGGPGSMMSGGMMGGSGSGGMGSMMGSSENSSEEEKPFDLRFIDQMTMHHRGAIMSSRNMISDSKRPELRKLAASIEESQSRQIDQMQSWRREWYPDASQSPSMMGSMMDGGMRGGSMQQMMGGDMADEMFLRMMIPHHQRAIDMSEKALQRSERPEVKDLARTIIDEQSAEIKQMKGYLEDLDA